MEVRDSTTSDLARVSTRMSVVKSSNTWQVREDCVPGKPCVVFE